MALLGVVLLLVTACSAPIAVTDAKRLEGGAFSGQHLSLVNSNPSGPIALSAKMAGQEAPAQGGGSYLGDVALSPDGQYLAAATAVALFLYRADTFELIWRSVPDSSLDCLAWSPDSRTIITGGRNGASHVWQAADGMDLQKLSPPTEARGGPCPVAWSPDGQRVADGRVMWMTSTWQAERQFWGVGLSSRWGINAIAWSPDGTRIAFANSAGDLSIADPLSMLTIARLCSSCAGMVRSLSWSPDGQRLAVANEGYGRLEIWDTVSGKIVKSLGKGRSRVAWSPDGKTVAVLSQGTNQVILLDTTNWRQSRFQTLPFKGGHLSWSRDSQRLVTASPDGSIILWPLDKALPPVASPPIVCKMSGSKVYMVVGSERRHIINWDTFLNLGYRQTQIIPCGPMASFPVGAPITRLLKGSGEAVYWMQDGYRRHIPDMETFTALGFQTKDISEVPDNILNLWLPGEPLPPAQP